MPNLMSIIKGLKNLKFKLGGATKVQCKLDENKNLLGIYKQSEFYTKTNTFQIFQYLPSLAFDLSKIQLLLSYSLKAPNLTFIKAILSSDLKI